MDEIQAGDRIGDHMVVEVIRDYWYRGVDALVLEFDARDEDPDREWTLKER